ILATRGVILGKSKEGHTLKIDENSRVKYKTSDVYGKTGLLIKDKDSVAPKYYKKAKVTDIDKYGYRRAFKWEKEEFNKSYKVTVDPESKKVHDYVLDESGDKFKQILESILKEINRNDQEQVAGNVTDIKEKQEQYHQENMEEHGKTQEKVEKGIEEV